MKPVVKCNKVLVVGDLHISDVFKGRHKNYLSNCILTLDRLKKTIKEREIGCLVLTGDIFGVHPTDKNIRNREVFSLICKFFKELKDEGIPTISVRGNHDFGEYPDFQFLVDLGLIETSQTLGGYFDFYGKFSESEVPEVRFHIVDYGLEDRELEIAEGNVTNIALTHNNFTIKGVTNWYQQHDGKELVNQRNFQGIYMIINGHIHVPSPELYFVDAPWGEPIGLFDLGCPTKPAFDTYESVWLMEFTYSNETKSTDFDAIPFILPSMEDTFFMEEDFVEDRVVTMSEEELEQESLRRENLSDILNEIISSRISNGDLASQVMSIPNASDASKELAVSYLSKAMLSVSNI